jgi:cell wall-associated NlpC family hydrolase
VPPGEPWCASFVTWSLQQAGHKLPGGGWGAVSTWVHNAEQGSNGLKIVTAEEARPGDIVAYDWGGQSDFGADGHIGFLASSVKDGGFNALEGNNDDAVNLVPRHLGGGPNIVFIRPGGDAPAGAGAAPADPSQAAAAAAPAAAAPSTDEAPQRGTLMFHAVPAPAAREQRATLSFLKAVQPQKAEPPAGAAVSAPGAVRGDVHLTGAVADAVGAATRAGEGPGPRALLALQEAEKHLGTPYHWGGSTPQTGFDCSGLMQWAYAHAGIKLPRVSEAQVLAGNGTPVDRDHLRPGDLVFFDEDGDIGHVGMYVGNDEILHAPHTGDVVRVASLDDPWFVEHFAGGRRFDQGATAAAAAAPALAAAPPPAVDPAEVASAHAAVARDAAEVQRPGTLLFHAVKAQEARKERMTVQFMKAIDPSQVKRPAAATAPPDAAASPPAGSVVDAAGAAGDYPGDGASQAQLARWLAKQAQKAGLPPELPVMASLVESGVRNLGHGDADSVGFFQMRVGIWDKGPYAGFARKPELQVKWFIDHALAVKRQAIASGNADFGKDPSRFGEWIADVEQPLGSLRGRYQPRLGEARRLIGG